jgi:hypothetical protein
VGGQAGVSREDRAEAREALLALHDRYEDDDAADAHAGDSDEQ